MKKYYTLSVFLSFLIITPLSSCKKNNFTSPPQVDGMVYIPAGDFYMGSRGSLEEEGQDRGDGLIGIEVGVDELPRHTVRLKGYYIDKFEVTNSQYKKFIEATGHRIPDNPTHTYDKYIWKNGIFPEGMEDNPVALVSFDDASAYCKWVGKRLPGEDEWEKACRGTDGRKWPWGNSFDPGSAIANVKELGIDRSSPEGGFPSDVSPYGVFDMGGNLREWTTSWYVAYPGSALKREQFGELFKVVKGGSWAHTSIPESRCTDRGIVLPVIQHRTLGFRCAKDAE